MSEPVLESDSRLTESPDTSRNDAPTDSVLELISRHEASIADQLLHAQDAVQREGIILCGYRHMVRDIEEMVPAAIDRPLSMQGQALAAVGIELGSRGVESKSVPLMAASEAYLAKASELTFEAMETLPSALGDTVLLAAYAEQVLAITSTRMQQKCLQLALAEYPYAKEALGDFQVTLREQLARLGSAMGQHAEHSEIKERIATLQDTLTQHVEAVR